MMTSGSCSVADRCDAEHKTIIRRINFFISIGFKVLYGPMNIIMIFRVIT